MHRSVGYVDLNVFSNSTYICKPIFMSTYVLANKDKQAKISAYTGKKNMGMHP